MSKILLEHSGADIDLAVAQFRANYLPHTYTLPEQVLFTATLDPTAPKVNLHWAWPSTDYVSGLIVRRKAGSLPEHTEDGELVCTISGTSTLSYVDDNFDKDDDTEVGTLSEPVTWYYRAFPYNTNGQAQTHYQTAFNRGYMAVNVYYLPESATLSTLPVGAVIEFGRYGSTALLWKVAHILSDRAKVISSKTQLGTIVFDAKEPNSANGDRMSYGSNRYSTSNIRQWLNTYGEAQQWFEPQTDTDVCDSTLNNKNGFLHDFTAAERGAILPEQKVCVLTSVDGGGTETVADLVWLPSRTELGLGDESSASPEGEIFQLFDGEGNTNANRAEGFGTTYWISTPNSSSASFVRVVAASGALNDNSAYVSYAVRAGLSLSLTTPLVYDTEAGHYKVVVV